jgi:starch phosphorylase
MLHRSDPWMTVADAADYFATQRRAACAYRDTQAWTRAGILNSAASGRFSSDRTIQAYNEDIWRLEPL